MKDRRAYILIAFMGWWVVWGALLTGIPFRIGAAKVYGPTQGCGTTQYTGLDIKNLQRQSMSQFQSVMKSGHPFGGPAGTTFDAVNYRKGGPWQNAGRTIRFGSDDCVNMFYGPINPKKVDTKSPEAITKLLKELGLYLGSVGVGVADLGSDSLKWLSTDDFTGKPLKFKPEEHRYALVFLQKEELVQPPLQTGMSMATVHYQAKVARGYFLDDYIAGHLAQFIRALGYHAVAHNNGYARSIPLAILAGLGELGRHGNLITLKFGPNGEQTKAFPEPEFIQIFFKEGATSPDARAQAADMARKAGVVLIAGSTDMYKNVPCPTYSEKVMAEPNFGKWPTWTDIWGRTIKGYEDGEKGYPRLDFRPLTEKLCSGVTSGIGTTIFSYEQLNVSPQFNAFTYNDPMGADPYQ